MEQASAAGDPRFYSRAGPFDLAALLAATGTRAGQQPAGPARLFSGVAPLQRAGAAEVSFLDNRRYLPALRETRAGAVIVHPSLAGAVPAGSIALLSEAPYAAWAKACALFHPLPPASPGIHPSAVIDPTAQVDASAEIGPFVSIGAGARIGPRCRLGPGVAIGPGVEIGADCRLGAHVSVSHALIGARVVLHPGARIGQEGFGFAPTPAGFLSVPQLGRVLIEDDVDIGANTTIDRGSAQDTVIGTGSRLDNLVQIAHNVRVGRMCVIVAMVGISGSTTLDDFVMIGGQAGLTGHLHIGAHARIGAQAGVMADVPARAAVAGTPALPAREHWRMTAVLRRLARRAGITGQDAARTE
jgi:UDP-3-O-[3-hydroxymyristoyl] glucosamine N-acyltransferase